MKAIVCDKYGSPLSLRLKEIPRPKPKENEVLIKIKATAVNDYDWSMVRGKPGIYRIFFGLFKPKRSVPGMELSGEIVEVGSNTNKFKIGDEVYGDTSDHCFGTFAEYISINENALTHKPSKMSHIDASATSHASMLAYQGLIEIGKIKKGDKILINGAGGGVGTFALQLAKIYNCEVTGVDTGDKLNMMKSIGFDHVIDFKKEDFTKSNEKYDLILDAKTTRPPNSYTRCLRSNSKYVTVGGDVFRLLQILFARKIRRKSVFMVGLKANKYLSEINDLYDQGIIKPIIDGPYSLEEVPQAIQRFGDGKHAGKIVITIS